MKKKNTTWIIIFFSIFIPSTLFYKKNYQQLEHFIFPNKFSTTQIEITGYNVVSSSDIENSIQEDLHKKNLLFLNPWIIHKKINENPLIQSSEVKKKYPDTLSISVEERNPLLLFYSNKKNFILDSNKKITEIDDDFIRKYETLSNLLKVEGDNISQEIQEVAKIFANKDFTKRIVGLYKIGNRRWDMIVDNKIKVMLPEKINEDLIVDIFNKIDSLKASNDLNRSAIYSIVDIRINKKIFIKNINE